MQLNQQIFRVPRSKGNLPYIWTRKFYYCSPCCTNRKIKRYNLKSKFQVGGNQGETMEAILFNYLDKSIKYKRDMPKPQVQGPDDVLIKVSYAGICGTDIHILQGEFPVKDDGPVIPGHEFSGVVEDVGNRCSMFKAGQHIVVDPNRLCNLCRPCRLGKYQYCPDKTNIGIFRNGGWAQYVTVPQQQVYALPDNVTLAQGALCEPYSCVWHGVDRASPIHIGQKILVIGAGIIGSMFITVLHLQGHRNVTVTEMNETRLAIVRNLETSFRLIHPHCLAKEKPIFDVIIDCTGNGKVMEIAFKYMNDGGKYVLFGCAPPTHTTTLTPYDIFRKELTVIGVKVNPFSFPHALGWLSAMGNRYLDYEKLGIETFTLAELPLAIEKLQKGHIAKAVLRPNKKNKVEESSDDPPGVAC